MTYVPEKESFNGKGNNYWLKGRQYIDLLNLHHLHSVYNCNKCVSSLLLSCVLGVFKVIDAFLSYHET